MAGSFGVEEELGGGVLGVGGGVLEDEFLLGLEGVGFPVELLGPELEVGEVDVGGEVLLAHAVVDLWAGEALLAEVGSEGAMGAAVVELILGVAVVDGEGVALLPVGCPGVEPVVVGLVDLDALVGLGVFGEWMIGGVGECSFAEVSVVEFEGDFFPVLTVVFEELAGEGVDEFVGEEVALAVGGFQGGVNVGVPVWVVAESLLLEGLEGLGGFDDVVGCGVVLEYGFGQCSVAGSDFDDGKRGQGFEPVGDGFAKDVAEGGGGGEVAGFANVLDFSGVVAEVGMVEGGFHECFKRKRGIAWRQGLEEVVAGCGHIEPLIFQRLEYLCYQSRFLAKA